MKVTFKVEGLAECEEALDALSTATSKNVLKRALTSAAQPIVADAQARAPRETGRLAASIIVGTKLSRRQRQATEKDSSVEIYVGAGPLAQATLQEFGTAHNAPQPFLRPAVDSNLDRVIKAFSDDLKSEVDKAMQRQARKAARILAMKG